MSQVAIMHHTNNVDNQASLYSYIIINHKKCLGVVCFIFLDAFTLVPIECRESIMIMGKRKVPSIPERVPSPMSANSCGWVGNGPEISGSRRDTEGELFLRSTATGAVGSLGRESLGSHFKTIASSGLYDGLRKLG